MAKAPTLYPTITINPMFKLLLWLNAILCVVTLGVMVWASTLPEPVPKAADRLFNACEHVFTLTAGAFHWALGRTGCSTGYQAEVSGEVCVLIAVSSAACRISTAAAKTWPQAGQQAIELASVQTRTRPAVHWIIRSIFCDLAAQSAQAQQAWRRVR